MSILSGLNQGASVFNVFGIIIGLLISLSALGDAYVFRKLRSQTCNGSCVLVPIVGETFRIKYNVQQKITDSGSSYFSDINLNGKDFKELEVPDSSVRRLPFYQKLFFNDHRFQIYVLNSSDHVATRYHYYFVRQGNDFFLLNSQPIATLFYDYQAANKKADERFYVQVGYGQGQYVRQNYKLEKNQLIEI